MRKTEQSMTEYDVQDEDMDMAGNEIWVFEQREANHIRRRESSAYHAPRKEKNRRWDM